MWYVIHVGLSHIKFLEYIEFVAILINVAGVYLSMRTVNTNFKIREKFLNGDVIKDMICYVDDIDTTVAKKWYMNPTTQKIARLGFKMRIEYDVEGFHTHHKSDTAYLCVGPNVVKALVQNIKEFPEEVVAEITRELHNSLMPQSGLTMIKDVKGDDDSGTK